MAWVVEISVDTCAMRRDVARVAAATLQVGLGLLAVLLCAFAAPYVVDVSGAGAERGLLVAVALLLGLPLFAVWVAARTRRRWLGVLVAAAAVLAVSMTAITLLRVWPAGEDPHPGLWTGVWLSAFDAGLWLLILAAGSVELRQAARAGDVAVSGWKRAVAIVAPLALVVLLPMLAGRGGESGMVRFNSVITDSQPAAQGRTSALSGGVRWQRDLTAGGDAVPTRSGLAVPVPSDNVGSAGVVMLDPSSGATVWRYQLHGVDDPPNLASTADGSAIVVSFDGGDLADGIPNLTYTLDAATGRIQAFWPDAGEVQSTDPPVLFKHVATGTNSVIAISPTGKKLWSYTPERCADPRSVASTPSVMIVRARLCGENNDGLQILGLDARTGEQRWAQPNETGQGESAPDALVVEAGHQLELTSDHLMLRQLDTGAISWTAPTPNLCSQPRYLVSAAGIVFLGQCDDPHVNAPTSLTAYAAASGQQLWRSAVAQPITSLSAVDDRGVLALTEGDKTCDVQRLQSSRTQTLLTMPADDRSGSAGVRCSESTVLRVGGTYLLQLELGRDGTEDRTSRYPRYRFVGLD
jgi:outer membrane protein assembly factor BamB